MTEARPPLDVERELDALFQQLPAAHVAARNALADRLRRSGDRAGAEQVKKLKRPAPSAAAFNRLHFQHPELLETARRATATLVSLHARDGVGPTALSAAVAARRHALQAALDAAVRSSAQAGLALSGTDQRKLETSLQAWLAGAGDEAPGRMTHELSASGFTGVSTVGQTYPKPSSAGEVTDSEAPEPDAKVAQGSLPLMAAAPVTATAGLDPERLARVRANVQKREQEADAARKLADQVGRDLAAQEQVLERLRSQTREAEQALRALHALLQQQEAALHKTRAHQLEASDALSLAERALKATRDELARLSPSLARDDEVNRVQT